MIKIRLRRTGAKKQASYRIVVAPSTSPRDGRFIENIGHYNPRQNPPLVVLKEDRLFHWLSVGGQPSDSVERLLKSNGYTDRFNQYKAGELVLEGETPAETEIKEEVVAVVEEVATAATEAGTE